MAAAVLGVDEVQKLRAVARTMRTGLAVEDMKLFGCDPWHAEHATGLTVREEMAAFLEGLAARLGDEAVNAQVGA